MVGVAAKTGLVGFFDIPGYRQMLLANDVAGTARLAGEAPGHAAFVAHNEDAMPGVLRNIEHTDAFVREIVENTEPRPWPAMRRVWSEAFLQMKAESEIR